MASEQDQWQRKQALFYQALELNAEARLEFLQRNCASSAERKEIEALVNSAEKPMGLFEKSVLEVAHEMTAGDPRPPIAPGTRLGYYEIVSLVGCGGMGEVYLAKDTRLGRKVALKMLLPELTRDQRDLSRFEQEARAASALNHPNILTIYDFGQEAGMHFIASEFIEGKTLRQLVSNRAIELDFAIDVAIQIAGALVASHANGIIHRDIKPENVIVRTDGLVKVLDFGIAKLSEKKVGDTIRLSCSPGTSAASHSGMILGTAKYMSPEQARGMQVDGRSDIFALGALIYELLTGNSAFEGETAPDVISEILKVDPRRPSEIVPEIPPAIEHIVGKALRKDRETRYQTVKDLLADLQDYKQESDFQAKLQRSKKSSALTPARGMQSLQEAHTASPKKIRVAPKAWLLAFLLLAAAAMSFYWLKHTSRLASPRSRTLAILPFRNLKADPATDFLGFSLANAVITKLGSISALTVRPSTSIDKYRNQVIDPKTAAAELNVDTLLTGTFLKDGEDLGITTQLVDVKADKILWQEAMNVKYDKLLTVQDRVAEQIIKGLELNLSPSEAANLKPEKPINSVAYESYLRGIDLYSLNHFSEAIQALEKATTAEPAYAPAWAYLGRAYTTHASLEFGGREDYMKAQAAYEKAITLNSTLAEPRVFMANLLTDTGRVEEAVPLLRSVLQNSPNNAEAHWELGYAYRFGGMLKESIAESEKARQNDPQVKVNSAAINSYLYAGEYQKFLESLPSDDGVYVLFYHGLGELYLNHLDQAAKDFDLAYLGEPSLLPVDVGKALSYSIKKENAQGIKLLNQVEQEIEERGVSDAEGMYKVAQAYAVLGDRTDALHMLRHSIGGGFFCYPYFLDDPLLQSLRADPEFQKLLEQALHRHNQFKASFFNGN
jgi:serine/threonine protein kinase/TolB-like protein